MAEAVRAGRWREHPGLTERQRALGNVAEKLTRTPTRMTPDDWDPLRSLGFDDQGCLEVAHLICAFNYYTRLADAFGLQPTDMKS